MSKTLGHCGLAALVVTVVSTSVWGGILYSEVGSGDQVWITSDAFVARSTDGGAPNFTEDPAANDPLSGSAYYFPKEHPNSPPGDQLNWWVEYQIPVDALPANFNMTGTWYFYARAQIDSGGEWWADADYLLVNGHPNDLDTPSPTESDWGDAVSSITDSDDRILNDISDSGGGGYVRPLWGWVGDNRGGGLRPKTLAVHDGMVTFRIYEREASMQNARIDAMVFASDMDYRPADADFQNAVPEPASLLLLLLGSLAMLKRRV